MISEIQNGETGASVRGKLNQAIASINSLNDNADSFLLGSTPPASRRDGSPLQVGDRFSTLIGGNYFWNGTYWLSCERFFLSTNSFIYNLPVSSGHIVANFAALPDSPIFFESLHYQRQGGAFSGLLDFNNRFDFSVSFQAQSIFAARIDSVDILHHPEPISFSINAIIPYAFGYPGAFLSVVADNIFGNPSISSSGSNCQFGLYWRLVL